MRKLVLTTAIVCSLVTMALAQGQKNPRAGGLVNPNKPAVFISFLRPIELEPLRTGYGRNHLLFRITNNTRWPIWLDMSGVPSKEYGDASLYYLIEAEDDGKVRLRHLCHVCSMNPVAPGGSIVFTIPTDDVSRDTRLRIAYSFQWERDKESDSGSYSTHSVVFYFSYLPKSVLLPEGLSNNSWNRSGISLPLFEILSHDAVDFRPVNSGVRFSEF